MDRRNDEELMEMLDLKETFDNGKGEWSIVV